jgi:hypothetical protein
MQPRPHIIIRLTTINHELVGVVLEDLDSARVHRARRRSMLFPLVHIAAVAVRVHLRPVGVTNDNGAVRAAERRPHHVGGRVGRGRVVDNDGAANVLAEVKGRVGHDVVDGIVDAVGRRVADGELVHEDPFLHGRDVRDDGHAGARDVLVVGDVVDDGAPSLEVGRGLVGELLAVQAVALVGVVGDELALVLPLWCVRNFTREVD